jgi:hypothetical protein
MRLILPLFFLLVTSVVHAYTPPAGTPLANNTHPRIWLSAETSSVGVKISEITSQCATSATYRSLIDDLVTQCDADYTLTITSQLPDVAVAAAINMAFLYAIDIGSLGITYGDISPTYTTNQYGDKAIEYANHIADKMDDYTAEAPTGGDYDGSYKNTWLDYYIDQASDWAAPKNLSLAIVNDWVNDRVTDVQRSAYMDALIKAYLYHSPDINDIWAGSASQHYGVMHNVLGVLGFYGETFDGDGASYYTNYVNTILERFEDFWIDGVTLLNTMQGDSHYIAEGTLYNELVHRNQIYAWIAISTALGNNYFEDIGYLKGFPDSLIYSLQPLTVSGDVVHFGYADVKIENGECDADWDYGALRRHILPTVFFMKDNYLSDAQMLEWYMRNSGYIGGTNSAGTKDSAALFDIPFNDEITSVTGASPITLSKPLSAELGEGHFVFRSNHDAPDTTNDTTVIHFNATVKFPGGAGHQHYDFAGFRIYKHGSLSERRTIQKSAFLCTNGSYTKDTNHNAYYNSISVYNDSDAATVAADDEYFAGTRTNFDPYKYDPNDAVWADGGTNHVGDIITSDINNTAFDYVDYDWTRAWGTRVDYAEREIVYLRSQAGTNDEYVIVYDRINTPAAADDVLFNLHAQYDAPLLYDGTNIVTMSSVDHPDDPDTGGGRWVESSCDSNNLIKLSSTYPDNNSHGALFARVIQPSSVSIIKKGGPGHQWEDARGKLMCYNDALSDNYKNYRGEYTMQIQPTTDINFNNMLVVMQIGDNNTLTAANAVDSVAITSTTGTTGNLTGLHIKDPTKNRIALFNDQRRATVAKQEAPFSYTATVTAASHHLLTNVKESVEYTVSDGSQTVATVTSTADGVLEFEDLSNVTGTINYTITEVVSQINNTIINRLGSPIIRNASGTPIIISR